tara:strand:- start:11813 stop:12991 length:1179 start_codon:yes stop_codon:yes gene_type:complete
MIDPKFKDILNISRVPDPTPEQILDYIKMRSREEELEQALKDGNAYMFGRTLRTNQPETNATFMSPGSTRMRNSVLFSNTFANPEPETNVTFMPPQPGSMYDNMVSPDDINKTRRDMMKTQANLAMTNNPINPMFNRPARPSGSALLNDVNVNNAAANILMGRNINKEAVADNLQKTIKDVDAREKEKRIAKRRERLDALRRFGLALQGKDPRAMDMQKVLKQLQMQNTQSIIQARENKISQENDIINYAMSELANDPNVTNKKIYKNNRGLLLEYGKTKLKENPAEILFNYVQNELMSVNKFREIQLTSDEELLKLINNSDKYGPDIEPKEIVQLIKGVSYEDYANNVQGIKGTINGIITKSQDFLTDGENTSLQLRKNLDPFFSPLQTSY